MNDVWQQKTAKHTSKLVYPAASFTKGGGLKVAGPGPSPSLSYQISNIMKRCSRAAPAAAGIFCDQALPVVMNFKGGTSLTTDEARQLLHRSEACLSSHRIFDYWLNRSVCPALCLALAKASFSDNQRYNELKEGIGYVQQ